MATDKYDYSYKFGILEFRGDYTVYDGKVGLYEGQLFIDEDAIENSRLRVVYDRGSFGDTGLHDLREQMLNKITELYLDEVEENMESKLKLGSKHD